MLINNRDNVEVDLTTGHKFAVRDIKKGENVIKYGFPIGHATEDIKKGDTVHTHNLATNLSDDLCYEYIKKEYPVSSLKKPFFFDGYVRKNGDIGIRNEIWIINTVGCVNKIAQRIADITGAEYFSHPYGCSQLGEDQLTTQKILCGLINHPNAAGVLVVGLGCENSNIGELKKLLGETDGDRVKFLNCQDATDEIAEGVRLVNELKEYASQFVREKLPLSKLKIGLKCGGSDGFSGITANPLVGRIADLISAAGGSCVLTEVPEMFGAEHLLMERSENSTVFGKTVDMINSFKDYYRRHGQVIYENPSPGNKAGGITTLEEKSLGCVTKGGAATVTDVLKRGEKLKKSGLSLLTGPGNDIVAVTDLTASGVHLILFTTGRGTPLGAPVPTIKIASNESVFNRKPNWMDFDASAILRGEDINCLTERLAECIMETASGKPTKNEINHYKEIAIFKDGVTL